MKPGDLVKAVNLDADLNSCNLTHGKLYELISVGDGYVRVVDDEGDPWDFNSQCFELVGTPEDDEISIGFTLKIDGQIHHLTGKQFKELRNLLNAAKEL